MAQATFLPLGTQSAFIRLNSGIISERMRRFVKRAATAFAH